MLLVAITGSVGSGKSTLLRDFAERSREGGRLVDGFISMAGKRSRYNEGADEYTWHWLLSGTDIRFAKRDEEGKFEIQPAAMASLMAWAEHIPPKQDLIVLDEFGKWEANGEGILPCWSGVLAAKPRMVVVTLREDLCKEIEKQIGRKFHVVLDAESGDVKQRLDSMMAELKDWEVVGSWGAASGGLECTLGTYLHTARFPFTGTIMGSAQAATLSIASKSLGRKELLTWISIIAAGLKAFSPGGTRIGPMIAIAMQGLLFTIGAMIGRWRRIGFYLGSFLVGLWSALQGFFIQLLLLGGSLERAWGQGARYVQSHFHIVVPNMWIAVTIVAIFNGFLCIALSRIALKKWNEGGPQTERFEVTTSGRRKILFWVPLVVVTLTYLFSGLPGEAIFWLILRVFAVSAALIGVGRLLMRVDFGRALARRGYWGPAVAIEAATDGVKE